MKIKIKNPKYLYVKKDVKFLCYCDFCGLGETTGFESECERDDKGCGNVNMQICYECVKQLNKLI